MRKLPSPPTFMQGARGGMQLFTSKKFDISTLQNTMSLSLSCVCVYVCVRLYVGLYLWAFDLNYAVNTVAG